MLELFGQLWQLAPRWSHSLQTLSIIFWHRALSVDPLPVRIHELHNLQELAVRAVEPLFCSPSLQSLRRIYVAGRGWERALIRISWGDTFPSLTHIRISAETLEVNPLLAFGMILGLPRIINYNYGRYQELFTGACPSILSIIYEVDEALSSRSWLLSSLRVRWGMGDGQTGTVVPNDPKGRFQLITLSDQPPRNREIEARKECLEGVRRG